MSLLFGSARHDENNKYSGGQPGDQTGGEVSTQPWYLHSKGWYRLRAKSSAIQKKLDYAMQAACANDNIGYCQNTRLSAYNAAKKVGFDPAKITTKVNVDCSTLVRICLAYAGFDVQNFTTANEKTVIMNTGQFTCTEITKESECKGGDILVTKTKGHTGICVSANSDIVILPSNAKEVSITTSKDGLKVVGAASLNIRKGPGTSYSTNGGLKKGEVVKPTSIITIGNDIWLKIGENKYISAKYVEGWIKETLIDKWKYITAGMKYYTKVVQTINGLDYAFDKNGYMITGDRITSNGNIKY